MVFPLEGVYLMSVISLFESQSSLLNAAELMPLIEICKSDSRVHGLKLREAHYKLGKMLAKRILEDLSSQYITVVIMMRAGLCFGLGIADELELFGIKLSVLFYHNEEQWKKEKVNWNQMFDNDIILTDAVINTGNNIIQLANSIQNNKEILFASNVLAFKSVHKFSDKRLYTTRISENSFTGSKILVVKDGKGPDTGDRLFTQYEFT